MSGYRLSRRAVDRLDQIYAFGADRWGEDRAEAYLRGLFDSFERIARNEVISRPIPAEFGVDGYYRRFESHFIYWRRFGDGAVGIVTLLHERMHRIDRFNEDLAP